MRLLYVLMKLEPIRGIAFLCLVLLCLAESKAQSADSVRDLIDSYHNSETEKEKYETILDLMEANALLSSKDLENIHDFCTQRQKQTDEELFKAIKNMITADFLYYKNSIDSSIFYYIEQAQSAEIHSDFLLATFGYGNAGYNYEQQGKLTESLFYRKKAIQLAELIEEKKVSADAYHNIGVLYEKLNKPDSAIHYIQEAIELDKESDNISGMVHNLLFLIDQYLQGINLEEAKKLCEECIVQSTEIGYSRGLAMCLNSAAKTANKDGMFNEANDYVDRALRIDEQRGDSTRFGQLFLTKAKALEHSEPNISVKFYEKAISECEKSNNILEKSNAALALSKFYFNSNLYDKCDRTLQNVESWISVTDLPKIKVDVLNLKYELYVVQEKNEKATQVLEEINEINTLRVSHLVGSQAENLSASYSLFKKEKEISELRLQSEIEKLKDRRKRNILIVFGLGFLLTTLLAYFALQNQKHKNAVLGQLAEEEQMKLNYLILEKEMDALRSQMNPHFLFNSLNSINDYIMHSNPKLASTYLAKFSKLMRTILNNSKNKFIPIQDELKAIRLYLEMEKLRFKDKFDFQLTLAPEKGLEQFLIPSMIIQPYIENAVKHGMMHLETKGHISLFVNKNNNGKIVITIKDNGIGRKKAQEIKKRKDEMRKSFGQEITADRIALLNKIYQVEAEIEYVDLEDPTGTEVILSLNPITQKNRQWKESKQLS